MYYNIFILLPTLIVSAYTDVELNCEGLIVSMECPNSEFPLAGLYSKSSFRNYTGVLCNPVREPMYNVEDEDFTIITNGESCPEGQVISLLSICIQDPGITQSVMRCNNLSPGMRVAKLYRESSGDPPHRVACERGDLPQKIEFLDTDAGVGTRVVITCLRVVKDEA